MKRVCSVYTLYMYTIYLSLCTPSADQTLFRKPWVSEITTKFSTWHKWNNSYSLRIPKEYNLLWSPTHSVIQSLNREITHIWDTILSKHYFVIQMISSQLNMDGIQLISIPFYTLCAPSCVICLPPCTFVCRPDLWLPDIRRHSLLSNNTQLF